MDDSFLNKLTEILEANLENEHFGVSELARELGMSRSNLHRKIKAAAKISANQFIRQFRLHKGMEMLKQTSLSVSEVSYKLGFSSPSYFIKCFHDYYGYSPGEVGNREESESIPIDKPNKKRLVVIVSSVFFMVLIFVLLFVVVKPFSQKNDKPTIAILPFEDYSAEGEKTIIRGIRAELHNTLVILENLIIVPRKTSDLYEKSDKTRRKIGRELNADFILDASGETIESKTGINFELIDVSTGNQVWSFDTVITIADNIFEIKKSIALDISNNIRAEITKEEKVLIETKSTENTLAYQYYLWGEDALEQAKFYQNRGPGKNKSYEAQKFYKMAVDEDSTFADAYVKMAHIYQNQRATYFKNNASLVKQFYDSSRMMLEKAILYDDRNSWSYKMLGKYHQKFGNEKEAEIAFARNQQLIQEGERVDATGLGIFWKYAVKGQSCEAIESYCKYLENKPSKEPYEINSLTHFIKHLKRTGHFETARKYTKEIYKENKQLAIYKNNLANIEWLAGNYKTALQYSEELFNIDTTKNENAIMMFYMHIWLRKFELAEQYFPKFLEQSKTFTDTTFADNMIGYIHLINGNDKQANYYFNREIKKYKEQIEINIPSAQEYVSHLSLVMIYSVLGEKENAIKYLSLLKNGNKFRSIHIRYFDFPMLDNIREEPEYKEVFQYVEKIYLEEHERVGELLREFGEIE